MSQIFIMSDALVYLNALICIALALHGVLALNHMSDQTPLLMRIGLATFVVGAVGMAVGPFYGLVSADPAELLLNFGMLVYATRVEVERYIAKRAAHGK